MCADMLRDWKSDDTTGNSGSELKYEQTKQPSIELRSSDNIEQPSNVKSEKSIMDEYTSDKSPYEKSQHMPTKYHDNRVVMMTLNETMSHYEKGQSLQSLKVQTTSSLYEDYRNIQTQHDYVADFVIRVGSPFGSLCLPADDYSGEKKQTRFAVKDNESLLQQKREQKKINSTHNVMRLGNDQDVLTEKTEYFTSSQITANVAGGQTFLSEDSEKLKEIGNFRVNNSFRGNIDLNKSCNVQKNKEDRIAMKHCNDVNLIGDTGILLGSSDVTIKKRGHQNNESSVGNSKSKIAWNNNTSNTDVHRKLKTSSHRDDENKMSLVNSKHDQSINSNICQNLDTTQVDINSTGESKAEENQKNGSDILIMKPQGLDKIPPNDRLRHSNMMDVDGYVFSHKLYASLEEMKQNLSSNTNDDFALPMSNDFKQSCLDKHSQQNPCNIRSLPSKHDAVLDLTSGSLNTPNRLQMPSTVFLSQQDGFLNAREIENLSPWEDGKTSRNKSNEMVKFNMNEKSAHEMRGLGNSSKGTSEQHKFTKATETIDGEVIRRSSAKSTENKTNEIIVDIRLNTASEYKRNFSRKELKDDNLGVAYCGDGTTLNIRSGYSSNHDEGDLGTILHQDVLPDLSDTVAQMSSVDCIMKRRKSSANSEKLSSLSSCTSPPILEITGDSITTHELATNSTNKVDKKLLLLTQTQAVMLPVLEGAAYYDQDCFKRFERQNLAEQRELKRHFRAKIAEARKTLREARKRAQEQTVAKRFDEAVRKHKEMQQRRSMRKSSPPKKVASSTPIKPVNPNQVLAKAALTDRKDKVEMREIQKAEAQLDRAKAAKKLKERIKVEESSKPSSVKAQIRKDRERTERYEVEYLISEMRFLNMDDYATKLVQALARKDELETSLRHQLKQKRQLALQMARKQKMEEIARIKEEERRRKQEEKERLERERREREALELIRRREEALRQREKNLKLKEMYNFSALATDLSRSYTYSYLPALKQPPPVQEVKRKKPKIKNVKPRYLQSK